MLDDSYKQAREVLRRPEFFETRKYYEQKTRANRDGAHPIMLEFERKFLAEMKRLGIPMFAHCVVRTPEEQQQRYDEGRSKALPWFSPHQYGMAGDYIHSVLPWDLPSPKCWDLIIQIAKEVAHSNQIDLVFGHDWGWDSAHIELANWRELAGLTKK